MLLSFLNIKHLHNKYRIALSSIEVVMFNNDSLKLTDTYVSNSLSSPRFQCHTIPSHKPTEGAYHKYQGPFIKIKFVQLRYNWLYSNNNEGSLKRGYSKTLGFQPTTKPITKQLDYLLRRK